VAVRAVVGQARTAFQHAIDSAHPDAAPEASLNLGSMLHRQGDDDAAHDAYQHVLAGDNPGMKALARHNLSILQHSETHDDATPTPPQDPDVPPAP
jgi:Tfp pilus assembly protein PilF